MLKPFRGTDRVDAVVLAGPFALRFEKTSIRGRQTKMPASPGLVWKWISDPLTEKMILNAEKALQVVFPADYRACVRENHGGAPEPSDFTFIGANGQQVASQLSLLLTLDPREDENVLSTVTDMTADGRLPAGLIPIINDGSGNLICLDYRSGQPKVAYLSLESEIVPIADSFGEFLGKL